MLRYMRREIETRKCSQNVGSINIFTNKLHHTIVTLLIVPALFFSPPSLMTEHFQPHPHPREKQY